MGDSFTNPFWTLMSVPYFVFWVTLIYTIAYPEFVPHTYQRIKVMRKRWALERMKKARLSDKKTTSGKTAMSRRDRKACAHLPPKSSRPGQLEEVPARGIFV